MSVITEITAKYRRIAAGKMPRRTGQTAKSYSGTHKSWDQNYGILGGISKDVYGHVIGNVRFDYNKETKKVRAITRGASPGSLVVVARDVKSLKYAHVAAVRYMRGLAESCRPSHDWKRGGQYRTDCGTFFYEKGKLGFDPRNVVLGPGLARKCDTVFHGIKGLAEAREVADRFFAQVYGLK
jgi:hypothetical protein